VAAEKKETNMVEGLTFYEHSGKMAFLQAIESFAITAIIRMACMDIVRIEQKNKKSRSSKL
jgi:hypothetical protein